MVAVAPVGIPLTVKVTGTGKMVLPLGRMSSVYVAVPPGSAVCVVPPLLLEPADRLKSSTVTLTVPVTEE
jgi:hypothetical protein